MTATKYIDRLCGHGTCQHKGHYVVMGRCRNCDWSGYVWITNGHEKAEASRSAECPRCRCRTITPGEFVAGNGFEGE